MTTRCAGWDVAALTSCVICGTHAAAFAAFGRSLHVRNGSVAVPGGDAALAVWRSVVDADASQPADFVNAIFSGDCRVAFVFDTIAHLDPPHQRFALGLSLAASVRGERFRSLVRAVETASPEWRADERPYSRPPLDVAVLLSTVAVDGEGRAVPPVERRIYERVFRADALATCRLPACRAPTSRR